jgi:hypothetical protein
MEIVFIILVHYIDTLSWKMRKSSARSKSYSKKGAFDQSPHPVEAQLCSYKTKVRPGDFVLIIEL